MPGMLPQNQIPPYRIHDIAVMTWSGWLIA